MLNPKDIYTRPVPAPGDKIAVVPTKVSVGCGSNQVGCIHEAQWAFHVTLGEAF